MKIEPKKFRVGAGTNVRLKSWPTRINPFFDSRDDYANELTKQVKKLSALQTLLYADDHYSLLLIFQGMDAAGKDSAIKHVMSGINPQGCQVFSFKHPGEEAREHDFLWRTTRCLPERGRVGIFNRSYYEEVLIVRVHPAILQSQRIPKELLDDESVWRDRYRSIVHLERHLHENGTRILKFFLHLSNEEQRQRFLARIDDPHKNWKLSQADVEERQYWKDYEHAYEQCLASTSTKHAPWYVVPADDKDNARLIISQIIVKTLEALPLHFPKSNAERRRELASIRKQLVRTQ